MKKQFFKMTAIFLTVLLLSFFMCLSVGADSGPPSQASMQLSAEISHAVNYIVTPGNDWTIESLANLKEKYEHAKEVLSDPASTDEDYIKAAEELRAAVDSLEHVGNDRSAIMEYMAWVHKEGLPDNGDAYTQKTYDVFYTVYERATYLAHDNMAPQDEIDTALANLKTAVENLVLIGDVNKDKKISITDVLEIQKDLASINPLPADAFDAADTDGNGKIEINDCLQIQKYISKEISSFK